MPVRKDRVFSLDGLRGLGALLVFLYHVDIMIIPFGDRGGVTKPLSGRCFGHGVFHPLRCRFVARPF